MLRKAPWPGPKVCPLVVPRTILGATLVTTSLSKEKVLVTANPQPASKPRLIIGQVVAGGAEASPKGLMNFKPQTVTLRSTVSGSKNVNFVDRKCDFENVNLYIKLRFESVRMSVPPLIYETA